MLTANYYGHVAAVPVTVTARPKALRHRYRFNSASIVNGTNILDALNPQAAALYAVLRGNAAISSERLVLNGSNGTFVTLPPGIISNFSAVTIETWASLGTQPTWAYLFSFGDTMTNGAGSYGFSFTPRSSAGTYRFWVTDAAPGHTHEFRIDGPALLDNQGLKHIVAVIDLNFGSAGLYVDGALVGLRTDIPFGMSAIRNVHSYLGRSLYNNDPYPPCEVHEFRIYEGALTAGEVAALQSLGPTATLFDVRLGAGWREGQIEIQWPIQAAGFRLESTHGPMPGGEWVSVTNVPAAEDPWLRVTLPPGGAEGFFRLAR
jgi:hypothetical protein